MYFSAAVLCGIGCGSHWFTVYTSCSIPTCNLSFFGTPVSSIPTCNVVLGLYTSK